jgi:peptide-methionine (S)-S-oxide reductase
MRTPWIATFALAAPVMLGAGRHSATVRPVVAATNQYVVFSGGCFWGVQWVFQHVQGVTSAVSGYAGGDSTRTTYEEVSTGSTGNAESVRVTFDPGQVSFDQLLQVFFTVAHDPTEVNRQGPDDGPQYRSAIWYTSPSQKQAIDAYIAQLTAAKTFPHPIATQVAPLRGFTEAEAYHQDYAERNPRAPYIAINDRPKVERLRLQFPKLYREMPLLTTARGR